MAFEIAFQRAVRTEIADPAAQLADDESAYPGASALGILVVDPVIADLRVRHRHDLAVIGRVGEDLLISRHARVEDDLAIDLATCPEGPPRKDRPVFQSQLCDVHHPVRIPPPSPCGRPDPIVNLVYAAASAVVEVIREGPVGAILRLVAAVRVRHDPVEGRSFNNPGAPVDFNGEVFQEAVRALSCGSRRSSGRIVDDSTR